MYISDANNVVIEITRRCNMCCAHCLRGDAENVDIQEKYIDAFLDSFSNGGYIGTIIFTGGEISLNIPAIRYILKAVKCDGAREILAATGLGAETSAEMKKFIKKHERNPRRSWECERMRAAIPYLERIGM